jgi:ribosome biogenesis GTPase
MGQRQHGRVVAAFGRHFLVETPDGETVSCVTPGKRGGVACGDQVHIRITAPAQGVIESVAPRSSLLFRSDPFREKIIAANVTQAIVVVAAVPALHEELLNRCLIAAEAAGLKTLIVLNKSDLEQETARALEILRLYQDLGYPLLMLSARRDASPLLPWLRGETSVLVGQSGMGKSTLVNALVPEAEARTGEVSRALNAGRHTTTHARLYQLDRDSALIDSPGMQEFGLGHLSWEEIARAFVEFRPFLGHCRFNDCKHLVEPGCAVAAAAEEGKIALRRLEIYRRLVQENLAAGRR